MTAADERLTRAALALLTVATAKQADRDYVLAVAAELRVVGQLLWLRAMDSEKTGA